MSTLTIKLGRSMHEQATELQRIKDAMAMVLISRWEGDTAGKDDLCCSVCVGIYLEANAALHTVNKKASA